MECFGNEMTQLTSAFFLLWSKRSSWQGKAWKTFKSRETNFLGNNKNKNHNKMLFDKAWRLRKSL